MKINELFKYAENCQMEADKMAYQLNLIGRLALVQSICNFNLFWLSELSPLICRNKVIDFMFENRQEFKRKLSVDEFLKADLLITKFEITDFKHFKTMFSNYSKESNLFNNLKSKT
jgi:hypothetical protein